MENVLCCWGKERMNMLCHIQTIRINTLQLKLELQI